jgi:hypothetical protein
MSMLRDQVDLSTWDGSAIVGLWRTGSAAAHGYPWPDFFKTAPGEFDEATLNLSLYGALILLEHAVELYEKRARRHLA